MKKWLGIALTLAALLSALGAPWLAAHDPLRTDFAQSLKPPGAPGHPFGTDQLGRDLLARILHGGHAWRSSSAAAPSSSPRSSAGCSVSSPGSSSAGPRPC